MLPDIACSLSGCSHLTCQVHVCNQHTIMILCGSHDLLGFCWGFVGLDYKQSKPQRRQARQTVIRTGCSRKSAASRSMRGGIVAEKSKASQRETHMGYQDDSDAISCDFPFEMHFLMTSVAYI